MRWNIGFLRGYNVSSVVFINRCVNKFTSTIINMENGKVSDDQKDGSKDSPDKDLKPTSSTSGKPTTSDTDDSNVERIRKYLAQKLGINDPDEEVDGVGNKTILSKLTLDGIVDFIKSTGCRKVITMAGAGISTSAGIPDFRSPKSGLYHNLEKYNLPHPQAIFELDFFKENPEPFFTLAKELMPVGFRPTPSHYFIRLLWEKGLLLRHYTQNIDTLERVAGLPNDILVEAHGTFHTGHCLSCRANYTFTWMKDLILADKLPKCEKCTNGVVKPDIVFFGEMLPDRFHTLIERDFPQADLLIIMGSSLQVHPFASLVERVKPNCPRLLINREKVGMQDRVMEFLGLKQGLCFDPNDSKAGRDVAWLGNCDDGCELLAQKLGWGEELKCLIERERKLLDELDALED